MFGDCLCQVEDKAGALLLKDSRAQEVIKMEGHCFELLAKKVHTEGSRSNHSRSIWPELFYILTRGPELNPILDPKGVILSSNFDAESIEPPSKTASCMELLLTPAMTVKRKNIKEPLIHNITAGQVEVLDKKSNGGGEFVPKAFILEWPGALPWYSRSQVISFA